MINLYINERQAGAVTVLDLKGRVRVGGNTVAFHKSIDCLLVEKKTLIVLNLAGVTFIDPCGLGELVASQVSVENKGGQFKLVGLTETLCELLTVSKLLTFFDVYASEADAIQHLVGGRSKVEKPKLAIA